MKTAIYIEQGVTQLVLTPENDWEKAVCGKIEGDTVQILKGSFYQCRGGWVRQSTDDESLILVLAKPIKDVPETVASALS